MNPKVLNISKYLIIVVTILSLSTLVACGDGGTLSGEDSDINVNVNIDTSNSGNSSTGGGSNTGGMDSVITPLLPSGEEFCDLPNGERISASRILELEPGCSSCESLLAGSCPAAFIP